MKRTIRLTEKELTNLIKKVVLEQKTKQEDFETLIKSKFRKRHKDDVFKLLRMEKLEKCKTDASNSLMKAVDWWKKWLNHPITKKKYEQLHDDKFLDGMYEAYKKLWMGLLNSIRLSIYERGDKFVENGQEKIMLDDKKHSYNAFVMSNNPYRIFFNCESDPKNAESIFIHELQHSLNEIKPLNPEEKVTKLMGVVSPAQTLWNNLQNYAVDYGIEFMIPESLKKSFPKTYVEVFKKWRVNDEKKYTCDPNENLSRLYSVRKLFNIQPGQNITFAMLNPYIMGSKYDDDVAWLIQCWGYNGFEPIQTWLAGLNSLAKNNPKPSTNV